MAPRFLLALASLAALTACGQQQMAELVDRSNTFYGRSGWMENGQSIARYSDSNRATQDQSIAYKYQSQTHQYAPDAAVDRVQVTNLSAPQTVAAKESEPSPFAKPSAPLATAEESTPTTPAAQDTPANTGSVAFRWPAQGKIISKFGPKTDGLSNDGINIAAGEGDPIWAAADGEVAYVGKDIEGYGNLPSSAIKTAG